MRKKISAQQKEEAAQRLRTVFPEAKPVTDAPVREYMLKWLSAFAPDMDYFDAKSFCLPRLLYDNYLWHAFSFQKTDCYIEEMARDAFAQGFPGACYLLLNREGLLFWIPDGKILSPETVERLENLTVFDEEFSQTYVHTGREGYGPYYKIAGGFDDADGAEE